MAFIKNPLQDGIEREINEYSNDLETRILGAFGSIIESGSDSNGSYIKFENGVMITYQNKDFSTPVTIPVGSMFYSNTPATLIFPQPFISTPVTVCFISGSSHAWPVVSIQGNSYIEVFVYRAISNSGTAQAYKIACISIGRWK